MVSVGQKVEIKIDGSDKRYSGEVYFIAQNAEFTPKNISTKDERQNLLFAIKAKVNDEVLKKIKTVKENSVVLISGYLVNVIFEDGPWSTSLSRTDTGDGACEILLVETITVN